MISNLFCFQNGRSIVEISLQLLVGLRLFLFGFISFFLLYPVLGLHAAPAEKTTYPQTNLISFLEKWQPASAASNLTCELSPQWIGTVKRVYLRRGENVFKEDQPQSLRFSHLAVWKQTTNLVIMRGRFSTDGTLASFDYSAVYLRHLPSVQTVSEAKIVTELHKFLGPSQTWKSTWGFKDRRNWVESWWCFTTEADGQLRYLNVSAHVSSGEGITEPATIDILQITEGFFRPADPNSAAELSQLKTGAEVEAEHQADLAKARLKYPQPLRSIVEARQTPGDSDLVAFKRALNQVRRHPSPELFGQLAEWIYEGSLEIQGILDHLVFDDFLELEKWQTPQRAIALRALTDSLPRAKTSLDLEHLIATLLRSQGGGELKLVNVYVNVELKSENNGHSTTFGSHIPPERMKAFAELCRDALKEKYPELR